MPHCFFMEDERNEGTGEKLKNDIPTVFLALKDKDTPILAQIIAGVTVVYALSPIDLVPDFIPVVFIWILIVLMITKIIL